MALLLVYYQSQQQVSVSPKFAPIGKGLAMCPRSVLLPSPASPERCRVSFGMSCCVCSLLQQQSLHRHPCSTFYTPCSSEPLCRPAFNLGNFNNSFCTHFVSVYHPYLAKREIFASCKHPPVHPTAKVSWALFGGDAEHLQGPRSLPKRLPQMTKFCTLTALRPRTKRAPA